MNWSSAGSRIPFALTMWPQRWTSPRPRHMPSISLKASSVLVNNSSGPNMTSFPFVVQRASSARYGLLNEKESRMGNIREDFTRSLPLMSAEAKGLCKKENKKGKKDPLSCSIASAMSSLTPPSLTPQTNLPCKCHGDIFTLQTDVSYFYTAK